MGVGVYLPSGETTICLDARPLTEPLRPIDVSTELHSSEEEGGTCLTLYGGKTTSGRPFRFLLEPGEWWELVLNIHLQKGAYDAMVRQGSLDQCTGWWHSVGRQGEGRSRGDHRTWSHLLLQVRGGRSPGGLIPGTP